jgi:YHS domain-containing protein
VVWHPVVDREGAMGRRGRKGRDVDKTGKTPVKCPVCRMEVDPEKCLFKTQYYDRIYYFCTDSCLKIFRKNPEQFVVPGWRTELGEDII